MIENISLKDKLTAILNLPSIFLATVEACVDILIEHGFCSREDFDDRVAQKVIKDIGREQWDLTYRVLKKNKEAQS